MNKLNDEDSEVIRRSNALLKNNNIKTDLAFINTNFNCISAGIIKLQTKGLSLQESIGVMEEIKKNLAQMENKDYVMKLNSVLKRNGGYQSLSTISNIIFNNVKKVTVTSISYHHWNYLTINSVQPHRWMSKDRFPHIRLF